MDHSVKSAPFKVKGAGPDDGLKDGQFEGYASVFGNIDSYGDIVEKGAFAKSLGAWQERGAPIPLLWGHDFSDPYSNIGTIDHAEEDDHGLKVRGTFDLDNPKAAQVYRLVKGRRVSDMSFAYKVIDSQAKADANHLTELHIYEASIVPAGANHLAGVGTVKATVNRTGEPERILSATEWQQVADAKAGRVLSAKNESLIRDAVKALQDLLTTTSSGGGNDQEKASEPPVRAPEASDDEPCAVKSPVSEAQQPPGPSVEPTLAAKYNYDALLAGQEGV